MRNVGLLKADFMNVPTNTEYRDAVYDPDTWRRLARELVDAAESMEGKLDDFWEGVRRREWNDAQVAVYFMLCAYALENLIKAKLVEKEISTSGVPSGVRNLPKNLKGHDLVELTIRCGRKPLAEEYASILKRLSRSSVWYGRYPVPVSADSMNAIDLSPSGEPVSLTAYSSNDRHEIKKLFSEFGLKC